MGKITMQEIVAKLREKNGFNKKESTDFVNKMFDIIQQTLERDKVVKVKGLGTFKIIDVDARESVNVNTGERVLIEGHGKITFTPDPLIKELVNKPFSQFETVVLNEGVEFEDTVKDEVQGEKVGETAEMEDYTDSASLPLVDFTAEEDIPEWVKEPNKPAAEQVVEEQVVEEPIAEEPVVEDSVIQGPQKVETLLESDNPDDVSVESSENNEDDLGYGDEMTSSFGKNWLLFAAACLVGLIAGYFIGNQFPLSSFIGHSQEPFAVAKSPVETNAAKSVMADQQMQKDTLEATVPEKKALTEEQEKVTPKEAPIKETSPVSATSLKEKDDIYGSKDSRVRTGAYRIVGTDKVVKALAGDNVAKVSRRYLGQGMECYVEVYNDLTASSVLTAGQEIKIPKLEIKKKKKVQN